MASAKGQRTAAMYGAQQLTDANTLNTSILRQNQTDTNNELNAQTNSGLDALYTGVNRAKDQINGAVPGTLAALTTGYEGAYDTVGNGYAQGRADIQTGIDRLNPFVQSGIDASRVYQGSLGLGGDAARQEAVDAFHTSPGFEGRQALATDAVARQASALGTLGGGNTYQGVTDRAYQLGDAEYGGWQDRLSGLATAGQSAATTQSNMNAAQGTLAAQGGTALGGLTKDYYGSLGGALKDNASSLAGLELTAGTGTLGARQGLGGQIAGVNSTTTNGLVTGNYNTAKGISDLAYEAGKAGDAAKSANQLFPLQAIGSIANLGKSVAGLL